MITLYSTHCPQCRALEMKLDKVGIEYEVCDDKEAMLAMGLKAAPVLDIGNGHYLMSPTEIVAWINQQE